MVRTRHLKVGAAWVLALLACARLAHAQATGPAAAADTREVNLRAYVELLRSDLRAQKVAIITEVMQFTEAEDAKFWPVYREYETELAKINDDRIALIKEYAASYETLTDATADRLARGALDLEAQAARAQGEVLRALQVGAPAEDGGAVPPGRASDPAAPGSADRRVTAHRVEVTAMRMPLLVVLDRRGRRRHRQRVALRRSRAAPVGTGRERIVHERRRQGRPPAARQRPDRRVPGRRRHRGRVLAAQGAAAAGAGSGEGAAADHRAEGTVLSVRLTQAIDVDAAQAGMTFKSVLDDPVMIGGQVVLPRGAAVVLQAAKVEQAGKMKGADKITLKANSIAFGGRQYEIVDDLRRVQGLG